MKTATINGVQLTEEQLRDGLKQIEKQAVPAGWREVTDWERKSCCKAPVYGILLPNGVFHEYPKDYDRSERWTPDHYYVPFPSRPSQEWLDIQGVEIVGC